MGAARYTIAISRDAGDRTWRVVLESVTSSQVLGELAKLKRHNARGWGVHVRPQEPHGLIFLDDIAQDVWKRMIEKGYEPACIVISSPDSYQLWMRHHHNLHPDDRRLLACWFARRAGGDSGGIAHTHSGRLAGFTNRKPQHVLNSGRFPFVLVERSLGLVYTQAEHVLGIVLPRLRAQTIKRRQDKCTHTLDELRPIEEFHLSERYQGDLHKADLAWVRHAHTVGLDRHGAFRILRHEGRNLQKKGSEKRQDDYCRRTLDKVYGAD